MKLSPNITIYSRDLDLFCTHLENIKSPSIYNVLAVLGSYRDQELKSYKPKLIYVQVLNTDQIEFTIGASSYGFVSRLTRHSTKEDILNYIENHLEQDYDIYKIQCKLSGKNDET